MEYTVKYLNISCNKAQNLSRLILLLCLHNLSRPGVKLKMKMYLEQRRQAMLQLHLNDEQFHYLLRCDLYQRFDSRSDFELMKGTPCLALMGKLWMSIVSISDCHPETRIYFMFCVFKQDEDRGAYRGGVCFLLTASIYIYQVGDLDRIHFDPSWLSDAHMHQ